MKFKNWLNEMGYIIFPQDVEFNLSIHGPIIAQMFDMKYERQPPPYNKLGQYDPIIAKMPNSHDYLVWDGSKSTIKPLTEDEKQELLNKGFIEMPEHWWKYADLYKNDEIVKKGIE